MITVISGHSLEWPLHYSRDYQLKPMVQVLDWPTRAIYVPRAKQTYDRLRTRFQFRFLLPCSSLFYWIKIWIQFDVCANVLNWWSEPGIDLSIACSGLACHCPVDNERLLSTPFLTIETFVSHLLVRTTGISCQL